MIRQRRKDYIYIGEVAAWGQGGFEMGRKVSQNIYPNSTAIVLCLFIASKD